MSSTHRARTRIASWAALSVAALGLAACGSTSSTSAAPASPSSSSSSASATPTTRTTYPLTIDNCGVKQTFTQAPKRVVILNGTSVAEIESFLVLGLEGTIVANAQSYGVSDDPTMVERIKAVPTGDVKMNKNFDVPAEQVLALKPDLVVSTWSGGFDGKLGFATREQLAAAGSATLVPAVNCANGKPDATAEEKAAYANASVTSAFDFITLLGQVFDVQDKAEATVADLQGRLDAVAAAVKDRPAKRVLIAFPGMSMMTSTGVPAVFAGGVYDDIVKRAGGVNAFAGKDNAALRDINTEALSAAKVDVLATGTFTPQEKPQEEAAKILTQFPSWEASKTNTFVTISDGAYIGPSIVFGVEKLAKAMHPDAF